MENNNFKLEFKVEKEQLEKLKKTLKENEDAAIAVATAIDRLSGKGSDLEQLAISLTKAAGAGLGVASAIIKLLPALAEMAGPIGVGIGALVLASDAAKNENDQLERSNQILKENKKLRVALGDIKPEEYYNDLSSELVELVKKRNQAMMEKAKYVLMPMVPKEKAELVKEFNAKINELDNQILKKRVELRLTENEIEAKAASQQSTLVSVPTKPIAQPYTPTASGQVDVRTLPNAKVNPLAVKKAGDVVGLINTQMKEAKLATVELTKGLTQVGQQGGKSFFELINLSGRLKDTLVKGFDQIGQSIQQNVHNKLVQTFNGAHSIAQQFFVSVLDQLTAIAAKTASGTIVAGLLSFIPGVGTFAELFSKFTGFAGGGVIPEPVLGIGLRSGTGYTFGERGPEYVMPNSQLQSARFSSNGSNQLAQRIAGLEKAIAGGTWRISGRDIVYSYDRNSYGVNQRRF